MYFRRAIGNLRTVEVKEFLKKRRGLEEELNEF